MIKSRSQTKLLEKEQLISKNLAESYLVKDHLVVKTTKHLTLSQNFNKTKEIHSKSRKNSPFKKPHERKSNKKKKQNNFYIKSHNSSIVPVKNFSSKNNFV